MLADAILHYTSSSMGLNSNNILNTEVLIIMSESLAKIWARRIHAGAHTIEEVIERYGEEGADSVRTAYYSLYGEEI